MRIPNGSAHPIALKIAAKLQINMPSKPVQWIFDPAPLSSPNTSWYHHNWHVASGSTTTHNRRAVAQKWSCFATLISPQPCAHNMPHSFDILLSLTEDCAENHIKTINQSPLEATSQFKTHCTGNGSRWFWTNSVISVILETTCHCYEQFKIHCMGIAFG